MVRLMEYSAFHVLLLVHFIQGVSVIHTQGHWATRLHYKMSRQSCRLEDESSVHVDSNVIVAIRGL